METDERQELESNLEQCWESDLQGIRKQKDRGSSAGYREALVATGLSTNLLCASRYRRSSSCGEIDLSDTIRVAILE